MGLDIIAEVGSNWWRPGGSSKEIALQCIRTAAKCGVTAVKFQLFRADSLYSKERDPIGWQGVKPFELPLDWLWYLRAECYQQGVEFWLSVFSPDLIIDAKDIADVIKIASGDITNEILLKAVANAGVDTALSTGGATDWEVRKALSYILPNLRVLFYCVSNYPARPEHYHLDRFPYGDMIPAMGISDHTKGYSLIERGIELGYKSFEVHFMLEDTPASCPDVGVSLSPDGLRYYCSLIRARFDKRYRLGFGKRLDWGERRFMRRGEDGLRPEDER